MSTDRKKQLREEYKKQKPDMGVFVIENLATRIVRLGSAKNLNAIINRTLFQLNASLHPNAALQKEWTQQGESGFSVRVHEVLPRDESDDSETDYTDDLKTLLDLCLANIEGAERI